MLVSSADRCTAPVYGASGGPRTFFSVKMDSATIVMSIFGLVHRYWPWGSCPQGHGSHTEMPSLACLTNTCVKPQPQPQPQPQPSLSLLPSLPPLLPPPHTLLLSQQICGICLTHRMKELDSEVAGNSKDTQRIQPKRKTQLSRTVRPVGEQQFTKEIEKEILFGHEGTKHSTRTERPVGGQQSTQLEEIDIDFRVPGLSHAVVKETENFRVQELLIKFERHPYREAPQADLQQNNVYNPFSNNTKTMIVSKDSKKMIRELGNAELLELCETVSKYNVLTVFSIGIKELSIALADNA